MSLSLATAEAVMRRLYAGVSGYGLSHQSRGRSALTDRGFVYGEVLPAAFQALLASVAPRRGEQLVDLGSGLGKAVLLASMLFEFGACEGHELLPELAQAGLRAAAEFPRALQAEGAKAEDVSPIRLFEGDLLQADLSRAGVIFAHASCFEEPLLKSLSQKLNSEAAKGARVLLVGHWLDARRAIRRETRMIQMDWGETVVNTYELR